MIFSCAKYDNVRRKAHNDINEVDDTTFQIGNKIESDFSLAKVI